MANTNEPQVQAAPTKTLVWKLANYHHNRYITPEDNGVSKVYNFHRDNNHTLEVDAADAAVIMDGPDKAEFRIKQSKADGGE